MHTVPLPFFARHAFLVLAYALCSFGSAKLHAEPETIPAIKVMSFNIRYGAANDGENSWPHRNYLVKETIHHALPDLIGFQEVLDFQVDFLKKHLTGFGFHGVAREDGQSKGEFVPLMYRTSRFDLVDAGHFWLSETPDIPGSVSWDSSLTRMLSWVILSDRANAGREFCFANVHFDHRGAQARLESARMIRERAEAIVGRYPIILTGDFNTTEDDPPYNTLVRTEESPSLPFADSFRVIHPTRSPMEASFSRWVGHREGSRIDWILFTDGFTALNASINYTQEGGRFPSDHYPVEAILRPQPAPRE